MFGYQAQVIYCSLRVAQLELLWTLIRRCPGLNVHGVRPFDFWHETTGYILEVILIVPVSWRCLEVWCGSRTFLHI